MADRPPTTESLVLGSCEPSPDSCLEQHARIRILFISNIPIPVGSVPATTTRTFGGQIHQHLQHNSNASRGLGVEVAADTEGGPLRGRILSLMRERTVVTHSEVRNAFPAASEFYSPQTRLRIGVEEATSESPSLWENMHMHKRLGAVVTVVNGACATAKQQLAAVKAMFQQRAYASVVGRCFVFEGSDDLMATVDRAVFKRLSIAEKPLAAHVDDILLSVTSEVVHYFTHRVNNLQTSTSHQQVVTPLDRGGGSSGSGGGGSRQIEGKVLAGRAAKQQGDVLLQLGATTLALQAYAKAIGLDALWTAATLEAFAAARYLDNSRFFSNAARIDEQLLALCAGNRETANTECLALLDDVMNIVGSKLEHAVRIGPLPPTTRQRIVSEVEGVMMRKLLEIKPKISYVKELISTNSGDTDEDGDPTDDLRSALTDVQSLYTSIARLSYAELELYLSEAYFLLPNKSGRAGGSGGLVGSSSGARSSLGGDSVRLLGLETELLLKLASLRAEQRNAKALLECIGTLHSTLPYLGCCSTRRELLISRRLPDLCYQCGCLRKAVYYLQQSAANDRENGRTYESLQSLLKACDWCEIPIAFDASRGGLTLKHDFTISSANASGGGSGGSNSASSLTRNNSSSSSSSSSSVRVQVSLLLELLSTLRSVQDLDESQWGLACHVAALLIFKYYDYIDDVGQSKLNFVLQTCSVTLPMHLRPTIVSPPLIRAVVPLPLPPHLCPQNQHVSGVKFIRFNTKTALFCFEGEIMKTSLVWVAGECAQVQIQIVNPFRNEIQLSSVAIRCRSKAGTPNAATSYVTHGALVRPQGTDTIVASVLPLVSGILVIEGAEVRIGQSGFRNPISIGIPPIEVPVMAPIPLVTCSFNVDEVELFSKQQYHFTATIHNIGTLRIDDLTFTLHRDDCNLQGCEGCIEKPNPAAITATVDRSPLSAALPIGAGGSVALKASLVPPSTLRELREEYVIARIEYSQRFGSPLPPRDVSDATTPTYAPIPRRTHDARLRVFLLPGVEVVDVSISADRRYVLAQVQCLSDAAAIVLLPNDRVPFEKQANVTILPRQSAPLRFVIARVPREERAFSLAWHVQDRPDVGGVLPMDFTALLEHVRCTEPLEDVVVCGDLLDDQHRRANAHLGPAAAGVGGGLGGHGNAAAANAAAAAGVSWASFQQCGQPYLVSAVRPVRLRLTVAAPWQTVVPLSISISFDDHDDGAVVAGPALTRWMLGAGCEPFEEELEMYLFTTGEHTLRISVRDEEGREILFAWPFTAEHENTKSCPTMIAPAGGGWQRPAGVSHIDVDVSALDVCELQRAAEEQQQQCDGRRQSAAAVEPSPVLGPAPDA